MAADPIANYRDIRFDEQGRPYYTTASGQRSYLPPITAAQEGGLIGSGVVNVPSDVAAQLRAYASAHGVTNANPTGDLPQGGFVHSRGEWNTGTGQYDQHLNQGGLGGLIEGGAALAAPIALGALMPTTAAAGAGAGAGATAAGAGGATDAGAIISGWGAPTAAGAGGATSAITHALTNNIAPLAGMLTSLAGSGGGGGSAANNAQLSRLQAITEARMRRVDPLHQMVTQLAASRLPISVQRPIPNVPLPE